MCVKRCIDQLEQRRRNAADSPRVTQTVTGIFWLWGIEATGITLFLVVFAFPLFVLLPECGAVCRSRGYTTAGPRRQRWSSTNDKQLSITQSNKLTDWSVLLFPCTRHTTSSNARIPSLWSERLLCSPLRRYFASTRSCNCQPNVERVMPTFWALRLTHLVLSPFRSSTDAAIRCFDSTETCPKAICAQWSAVVWHSRHCLLQSIADVCSSTFPPTPCTSSNAEHGGPQSTSWSWFSRFSFVQVHAKTKLDEEY